jgi:hypothetical protein
MRMPFAAPTPVLTMTAVGVASPSAHGHAIASTVIADSNANLKIRSRRTVVVWKRSSTDHYCYRSYYRVGEPCILGLRDPSPTQTRAWGGAVLHYFPITETEVGKSEVPKRVQPDL